MEEENKKSSKKVGIIISVIIIILLIAGIIAWHTISNMDKNKPDEVLYAYIDCLKNQDYEGMYSLISDSTKQSIDKDTYLARNKNIYEGIEATNIEISDVETTINKKPKKYSVKYTMTFDTLAGKLSYDYEMNFDRQDDNKYYINWDSGLIFPGLKESYKIRVYSNSGSRGDILDRNGKVLATNNENGEREYPYGEITAHLVGYVRGISEEELEAHKGEGYTASSIIGKNGLELAFEDRLKGKNGTGIYMVDENENVLETIAETDMEDGEDIKTTIDVELQQKIYEEYGNDNGFSVAMNPKTGEVLAMVSTPSFDSNKFITGFTDEEWEALSTDEDTPMFARYESTWVPGSSFKPITGAIGLTTNSFTATESFGNSTLSWQKDESWGDYKVTTLTTYGGASNLRNALIYSDNVYFAKAAIRIGADTFAKQLLKIGFDKEMDFPISMSTSQFGSNNEFSSEISLADSGYGQGKILVNPLHIASVYSAFVNDGNMIKPYIEYAKTNTDTDLNEKTDESKEKSTEESEQKYWIENAFSKEAANEIRDDLIQVVENPNGTGYEARINGLTLAGKTGTAELKGAGEDEGEELGWFNTFVVSDEDDEQLLMINMIENVENRGGSHYLLPIIKRIIQDYLL